MTCNINRRHGIVKPSQPAILILDGNNPNACQTQTKTAGRISERSTEDRKERGGEEQVTNPLPSHRCRLSSFLMLHPRCRLKAISHREGDRELQPWQMERWSASTAKPCDGEIQRKEKGLERGDGKRERMRRLLDFNATLTFIPCGKNTNG